MKLFKKISRILCAVSATACLVGCAEKFSEKETKYYVAYSDILNPDGLLCGIDEDGNYTSSVKINLRDERGVCGRNDRYRRRSCEYSYAD